MTRSISDQWQKGEFQISTDKRRLDLDVIHDFLSNRSYWAQGRSVEVIKRGIDNSLNFGVYKGDQQIGFARVVTDYATFAWLADVFLLEDYRGQGIGKALVQECLRRARKDGCTGLALHTTDMMQVAMAMYERMGFFRTPEFDFYPVPEFQVKAYRLEFKD